MSRSSVALVGYCLALLLEPQKKPFLGFKKLFCPVLLGHVNVECLHMQRTTNLNGQT